VVVVVICEAFDHTVHGTTVHENAEDSFIDQMAMGQLLWKDMDGTILAASLEGLILDLIQVSLYSFKYYIYKGVSGSMWLYNFKHS